MHTENHIQVAGGVDPDALKYPRLCAHGMNSFADRDYDLALARLRRRRPSNGRRKSTSHQSKGTTMSPYLYHRLMRDKLAALHRRAGAAPESRSATTAGRTTYRQLDQRSADGLAVTLEWNPATGALRVVVVDREREAVTFPVSAADASDAFVHPFIYAGRAVCEVM